MIYLFTGSNGSGKTLGAFELIDKVLLKDDSSRPVYYYSPETQPLNINTSILPHWHALALTAARAWFDLPHGSIILIDEFRHVFPFRDSKNKIPDYVDRLSEHRSKGFDFVLTAQKPTGQFDPAIQGFIEEHYHHIRLKGSDRVRVLTFNAFESNPLKPSFHNSPSTKTTTSTTRSTDKTTGETTTTRTTTITNYDAQGNEVSSETSIEGKTEKSTAHGGSSCEVAPACTGDAVQCAILHQTWLNRCSSQSDTVTLDSVDFGTSDIQGAGDFQSVELIGEDNRESHDVSAIFSNLPAVGSTSAACPVLNLELGAPYGTLNFDFKPICDFGDYTRPIFSAIGYFILGMFLFATLRRL